MTARRPGHPPRDAPPAEERVVPVFAVTQGRTRTKGKELPIETVVTLTKAAARYDSVLRAEPLEIVRMCAAGPLSVAEIGAALRLPVGVARVLVGDLVNAGYLNAHPPRPARHDGRPSQAVLGRLLDGLRAR
jgi:hypothetical protein